MKPVDLSLAVARSIREAQDQVLGQVDPLLRAGYTSRRAGDTVEYLPKFTGLHNSQAGSQFEYGDLVEKTMSSSYPADLREQLSAAVDLREP